MEENITTKFKVDISELKAGITQANQTIKLANAQFKAATAGMDDWENSADGLSAKLEQLQSVLIAEVKKLDSYKKQLKEISNAEEENGKRADLLKAKMKELSDAGLNNTEEFKKYEKALNSVEKEQISNQKAIDKLNITILNQQGTVNKTEKDIRNYSRSLDELESSTDAIHSSSKQISKSLDDVGNSANRTEKEIETLGDGFTVLKGTVSGLIANGISNAVSAVGDFTKSIFTLSEATDEYRRMTAKIEGSANTFGYSIDFAKEQYKEFYSYLKDDQMATNAITNLMGMKVSTETVTETARAAIGVWSAYGDSIPIESLTESINETAQVRKITGSLADALNWAGISEDNFNAKLEKTKDTQEAANLIASTLNNTYASSKFTYDELSGSIIDANKAEIELKETQAELGETLQPLNTQFTKLQNRVLKSMSPAIKDITKEAQKLLDDIDWNDVGEMIGDAFKTAANAMKFLLNNIEPISAGIKGVAVAWGTYKTAQLTANVVTRTTNTMLALTKTATLGATAATVAHTTATEGATIATKALSLAQKMTPWGLVAGLIGGAVVGLVSYVKSSNDARKETDENSVSTNKLTEEYKELNKQLNDNRQSRIESLESVEAEIGGADVLLKKLEELNGVQDKTNTQKQMMQYYVERLNELIPELNLQYDQEKDKLNLSTEAIRSNIEAQKDLMLAKAAQKNLGDIAGDIAEAEIELADAVSQHAKNEKKLTSAKEEATKAYQNWIDAGRKMSGEEYAAWIKTSEAQGKAQRNYDKTSETVKGLEKDIADLNKEYDNTEKYIQNALTSAEIEKKLQALVETAKTKGVEIPKAVSDGIKSNKYALPQSIEELNALITYDSLITSAKENGIKVPKNLSDGVKSGELQPSQAVAAMNSLITFNDLLSKSSSAGSKVPEFLSEAIVLGQLSPAEAVEAMNNLVTFQTLLSVSKAAGEKVPKELEQAILLGKTSPRDAVSEMVALMKNEADKAPPEMKKTGEKSSSQFNLGLGSLIGIIGTTAKGIAEKGYGEIRNQYDGYYRAGGYVAGGINSGVNDSKSTIFGTMSSLALNMLGIFKNNLKIQSPSRRFAELAKFIPEGIRKGIEDNAGTAIKAVKNLTDDVVCAGEKIKIKLPIDMVKTKLSNSLNSLKSASFISSQTIAGNGELSKGDIIINQNNYSPKALSRLEIYRQTKNAIRMAKGAG